ncbi:MAG: type III pantothenate kinase, partial [Planctomycetota bacterium]
MDLVADIGNTRWHLGAFEGDRLVAKYAGDDRDGFLASLSARPARVALSSVNPKSKAAFVEWVRARLGVPPRIVGEDLRPRLAMDVLAPEKVGTDRL